MSMYLNPDDATYEMAVRSPIYVDKTDMLSFLNGQVNTNERFLSISRPRRFGKTLTAEMICAYFNKGLDTRALFSRFSIAQQEGWDRNLNRFNVIRINMLEFSVRSKDTASLVRHLQKRVTRELTKSYPAVHFSDPEDLSYTFEDIFDQTKDQFIVVIDEWDCVFREYKNDDKGQRKYLDFLRDLFKDKGYIALAYITGILPVKKYGHQSALNMFTEYSMLAPSQLAKYVGFTDEEVRALCDAHHRNYTEIRDWYDGYELIGIVPPGETKALRYQIYSPYSVVQAMLTGQIRDYWNTTETYEALRVHINRNFSGLKDMVMLLMNGDRLHINTRQYQNDMSSMASADDVLTLLIHLGYLAYDSSAGDVYIPNREVLDEYRNTIDGDSGWDNLYAMLEQSQKLLEATWAGDEKTVAALLEKAHMQTGNQTYNSEAALSYAVRLAYFNAEQYYTLIPEMQAGKGYADLIYLPSPGYPDKPALLVELKYNQDADTAISQIHRQQYPESLKKYRGNLILVGINYNRTADPDSAEFKHHSCIIERA